MTEPQTCIECALLEKDEKGNFILLEEYNMQIYVCKLTKQKFSIKKELAEEQAVCLEVKD